MLSYDHYIPKTGNLLVPAVYSGCVWETTMLYKILADSVVLLHLLWILFLIFGAFIGVRNRVIRIIHITGLFLAVALTVLGWYCPLTYLEVWLRAKHDPRLAYAGSFIIHYVERLVYLEISPAAILILSLLILVMNGLVYFRKSSAGPS